MAPATNVTPYTTILEGASFKGSFNSMEDENADTLENMNQTNAAKPPRNLSAMRHCTSSAWLTERVSLFLFYFFF